ncbi:MAG TPA: hypothetical protein VKQ29_11390 [Aliidongia sp.]|nr:hypothetical protein [Aliidongia sp.]
MDAETRAPAAQPTAEQIIAQLTEEQNFLLAVPAGLVAAIIGAVLWAAVVFVTNMELGLVAVAVGALVGYAVRFAGKGIEPKFGLLGAACAAIGWGLGTVLSDIAFLSHARKMPLLDVVHALTIERLGALISVAFQPMDLLFLGIAVYEGYRFSFRFRLKPAAQLPVAQARPQIGDQSA